MTALRKAGEQLFSPILKEDESSAIAKELAKEIGVSSENLPRKLAELSMAKFSQGFILQSEQAKAILSGRFNDKANFARIKDVTEALAEAEALLPFVCRYVLHRQSSESSGKPMGGAQLEFATRLLAGYLAAVQVKE